MNAQVAPADGRALPVLSPAVQAAQERLRELRRHFGVTSGERRPTADAAPCDAPTQKERRTPESATHPEGWAEIARRGLFSQPLVEHLRRVTRDEPRAVSYTHLTLPTSDLG